MERRITPSLVVSVIALVVALGGASYAAIKIPKNSVGTKQLKKKAVGTKQLKGKAVTGGKLASDSVDASKVRNGSLLLEDFQAGQVKPNAWEGVKDAATLVPITSTPSPIVSTPTVPAGNYVLLGRANVIGGGSVVNRIICFLGSDAAQNFTVGTTAVLPLSLNGTISLTAPEEVSLGCLKTAGDPQIAQAHVIAIPIAELTTRTGGT